MFHIILYNPEIPPNTGNIIRLCSNTGCFLHLIKPLGFDLSNKNLRRAALDYNEVSKVKSYENLDQCLNNISYNNLFIVTKFGDKNIFTANFKHNDAFLFGNETSGLPKDILKTCLHNYKMRIPMLKNNRSLNLSNAASIVVYEAWRQNNFQNGQLFFNDQK